MSRADRREQRRREEYAEREARRIEMTQARRTVPPLGITTICGICMLEDFFVEGSGVTHGQPTSGVYCVYGTQGGLPAYHGFLDPFNNTRYVIVNTVGTARLLDFEELQRLQQYWRGHLGGGILNSLATQGEPAPISSVEQLGRSMYESFITEQITSSTHSRIPVIPQVGDVLLEDGGLIRGGVEYGILGISGIWTTVTDDGHSILAVQPASDMTPGQRTSIGLPYTSYQVIVYQSLLWFAREFPARTEECSQAARLYCGIEIDKFIEALSVQNEEPKDMPRRIIKK